MLEKVCKRLESAMQLEEISKVSFSGRHDYEKSPVIAFGLLSLCLVMDMFMCMVVRGDGTLVNQDLGNRYTTPGER